MAKILTDMEMAEIIHKAVHDPEEIDCADSYRYFLEGLAALICEHFGGTPGEVAEPDNELSWSVGFHINDCVPEDGGVFARYDRDVTWTGGMENHE